MSLNGVLTRFSAYRFDKLTAQARADRRNVNAPPCYAAVLCLIAEKLPTWPSGIRAHSSKPGLLSGLQAGYR